MDTERKNQQTRRSTRSFLNEHEAKRLLADFGVPVVEERAARNADEAVEAAESLGYPVVLKGAGATLQHKSELGLVHLYLQDASAVQRAARDIEEAAGGALELLLVQRQVSGRRELLCGLRRDPEFGPVIVLGVGGTLTEALDDVVLRLAPLSAADVAEMAGELRSRKLLEEFRGEAAVSQESLERVLQGLARLAEERPDVAEVDINPLCVTKDGALVAVDALVAMEQERPSRAPRQATPIAALRSIFYPKSVAFVGASAEMGKWGYLLVVNTLAGRFGGEIHLVNPKGGTIAGRPVHKSLSEVPGPVDLVVVTIPANRVLDLIPECGAKGVRHMLVISSGFGEVDEDGRDLESRLVSAAKEAGLTVLGPNTMGISNPHARFFCTGSTVTPEPGGTAMVSQSGNLGTQLLAFAERQGLGIRAFAGSGNEAMITIEDYLDAFEKDDLTDTILLYVESLKDARRFFDTARRLTVDKPVLLLKGGQTPVGHQAAASHTGALASDDRVFAAMCRQAGIIKVEQSMDLLDLAAAFSSMPLPRGPRTAIMTWGGGWGVVTADLCEMHGLEVPKLDEGIIEEINGILPPFWSRMNPVDLVGDQNPMVPIRILESLAAWDGCDAVMSLGILGRRVFINRLSRAVKDADPTVSDDRIAAVSAFLKQFEEDFISHSAKLMERYGKPIVGVSLLSDSESKTIRKVADTRYRAVFFETPERAVKALAAMVSHQSRASRLERR